jgi:hypothetical protein
MIRQAISDFADDAAFLTSAFFVRNAIVLTGLSIFALVALAR